jgi:hypothetical protein
LAEAGLDEGRIVVTREVAADLQSADAEASPGMRLGEMPARIVDDVPMPASTSRMVAAII